MRKTADKKIGKCKGNTTGNAEEKGTEVNINKTENVDDREIM